MSELSKNALTVLEKRYLLKDDDGNIIETPDGMFHRVAAAVALAEPEDKRKYWEKEFYKGMSSLDWLPNSPTMMNAGIGAGSLSACFVIPIQDTMISIMKAATDGALVLKMGGGTGYGFSNIRALNSPIRTTHGKACGVISALKLMNSVSEMVTQAGKRKGANMGCLSVRHPQIEEFIGIKKTEGSLTNFNLSVLITDDFIESVKSNKDWELVNPSDNKVIKTIKARDIWDKIVEGAWENGEPGVMFIDQMNKRHECSHLGVIEGSNPCGR